MPSSMRPPDIASKVATCLAVTTGLCCGRMRMAVPRRMRCVCAAAQDIQISGSGMTNSASSPGILPPAA